MPHRHLRAQCGATVLAGHRPRPTLASVYDAKLNRRNGAWLPPGHQLDNLPPLLLQPPVNGFAAKQNHRKDVLQRLRLPPDNLCLRLPDHCASGYRLRLATLAKNGRHCGANLRLPKRHRLPGIPATRCNRCAIEL